MAQWNPQKKKLKASFFGMKKREKDVEPGVAPMLETGLLNASNRLFPDRYEQEAQS